MTKRPPNPDEQWSRVDRIFQQLLELSGEARSARLDAIRGDDPELAERLESLLSQEERIDSILDGVAAYLVPLPSAPRGQRSLGSGVDSTGSGAASPHQDSSSRHWRAPGLAAGSRIGPYRIVRKLGSGGMATVYLAHRDDGQWQHEVALKVLVGGGGSVGSRLREERQILAALDHPNIARFLGGGTAPDGAPYLVMEHVEGAVPITDFLDERRASVTERVRLFLQVVDAVQAAHTRLVAHRDLKPANVLVSEAGQVKLVDFGIAKLLDPAEDSHLTQFHQRVLTPSYASPEQATGERITAASDVYQLGLLLHELLAGARAYEVPPGAPAEVARAVTSASPAPPSTQIDAKRASLLGGTTSQVRGAVEGDLDTIVAKAIRKDPETRYSSAGALADDLRRYLDGRPVQARDPTLSYRVGKFVRQHRRAVALGSVAVLSLVGSTVFASIQAVRADRERDRAQEALERAERVTDFVTDVLRLVDPDVAGPSAWLNQELLDGSVEQARVRLADQPGALADVLGTIGDVYMQLGREEQALEVLRDAVALRSQGAGSPDGRVDDLVSLARAEHAYAQDYGRAMELYQEAVERARSDLGPEHPLLARALVGVADIVRSPGSAVQDSDEARRLIDQALSILRAQPRDDVEAELAEALYVAGTIHGRGQGGIDELEEALALRRSAQGRYSTGVAAILNDLALLVEADDPAAADTLLAEAIDIQGRLTGLNHPRTLTLMTNRAAVLRDRGRYAEAEPIYRDLLRIREEHFPEFTVARAYILHGLGWILAEEGKAGEAEGYLREMLEILRSEGDDLESARLHLGRSTLGRALARQGRYTEAEELLVPALEWYLDKDPDSPTTDILRERVDGLYQAWGRPVPEGLR